MPLVYFDASAFVKLLVEEPGTELAGALWDGCDAAVSSRPRIGTTTSPLMIATPALQRRIRLPT